MLNDLSIVPIAHSAGISSGHAVAIWDAAAGECACVAVTDATEAEGQLWVGCSQSNVVCQVKSELIQIT